MEKNEMIAKVKEKAIDNRISCTDARKLAQDLDVHPSEIGKICDDNEIKIFACELGCFE